MKQYIVTGMTCAACQAHVEKAVGDLKDVDSVSVSLLTNSMRVEGNADPDEVIQAVEKAGYGAHVQGEEKHSSNDLELSLCPSKVGGMMRTGGMTKGLLGFIGVFGLYTASEGAAGEGCQDS